MDKLFLIMNEAFLDTSFAIALSSVTDQNHIRAVKLASQIETHKTSLVTTQAILLEIGNALSNQAGSGKSSCKASRMESPY